MSLLGWAGRSLRFPEIQESLAQGRCSLLFALSRRESRFPFLGRQWDLRQHTTVFLVFDLLSILTTTTNIHPTRLLRVLHDLLPVIILIFLLLLLPKTHHPQPSSPSKQQTQPSRRLQSGSC